MATARVLASVLVSQAATMNHLHVSHDEVHQLLEAVEAWAVAFWHHV